MSAILTTGIIRNGRVEVAELINLPDGSPVTISCAETLFPAASNTPANLEWTQSRNERHCMLVRKKFLQGISPAESRELAELQKQLAATRKRTTPQPYDLLEEWEGR